MNDSDDLVQRLRTLGMQPIEPARQSADLTAMAGVRPARRGRLRFRTGAAAVVAGLLLGSTGLAAADVLPDPAQHVAHTALKRVGVDVPNPARYYDAGVCDADQKKNHGAYVRDDHSLAKSDCGKPVNAGQDESSDKPKAEKGPCQGKPSWAGNKSLTKTERSAAGAARAAQCGDQGDADEADDDTP